MSNNDDQDPRRGLMLVISSPSGAGKTTLARML
ncbi:MAG: guanylate kinase, partial [Pseudomonadota bacterium]|nr:guanylate kinase [Pseudomonadota bacterium]